MYSNELEEIIEAALADGEITEKERAVLHKRAASEGIDPDELDVVIEGRLVKKQKMEQEGLSPTPPPLSVESKNSNSKFGVINKCPNCGAVVESGSVKCVECGYLFRGIEGNSSVEKLSKQIQEANEKYPSNPIMESMNLAPSKRTSAIYYLIINFPVPNTKEDLLEFIMFLEPKIKVNMSDAHPSELKIAQAYKKKYNECINKAKMFFKDDPQFQYLFIQHSENKKVKWANFSPLTRFGIIYLGVMLAIVLLLCLIL